MLVPVQDSVLDHPGYTNFSRKQYLFKQHFQVVVHWQVLSAKKVISVSNGKLVSSKSGENLCCL